MRLLIFVSSTVELIGLLFVCFGGISYFIVHDASAPYVIIGALMLMITNVLYYSLIKQRPEMDTMAYGIRDWIKKFRKLV